jgi:hypothetical protein
LCTVAKKPCLCADRVGAASIAAFNHEKNIDMKQSKEKQQVMRAISVATWAV